MEYSDLYAQRITSLCQRRGITINKLATFSGLKQSTINNIICGASKNPTARTLHMIAIALNMTLAELLDFEELNNYSFDEEEAE
ncbi:MAG: helix-turn-helix transcriptional regulator [Clostridiales bacterium]|nr:helix-turn-helix transcriptional regulator [Clostridiales bacterium]